MFVEAEESAPIFQLVKDSLKAIFLELFPSEGSDCYSQEEIKHILKLLRKSVDAPPKLVFQSARVLFTGAIRGAELDLFLPFVTRQTIVSRLSQ